MKLFWITPKWPFPVADGARIATTQLIKNLAQQGAAIHLCSLVPENEKVDLEQAKRELGVSRVTLIRRKNPGRAQQLFSLFRRPFFPITLSSCATHEIAEQMHDLLAHESADLIVYDGLHAAAWRFLSGRATRL